MSSRLLNAGVTATVLTHESLPAADVVDGSPTVALLTLDTVSGAEVGLWEMTAGVARDTEVDEVFVVLTGRGSVLFEDGERIDLAPGVAVRLSAGERTVWTVTEPLRKIWVA